MAAISQAYNFCSEENVFEFAGGHCKGTGPSKMVIVWTQSHSRLAGGKSGIIPLVNSFIALIFWSCTQDRILASAIGIAKMISELLFPGYSSATAGLLA